MKDMPTPSGERSLGPAIATNACCVLTGIGGATLLALAILDFVAYTAFVLRFLR